MIPPSICGNTKYLINYLTNRINYLKLLKLAKIYQKESENIDLKCV